MQRCSDCQNLEEYSLCKGYQKELKMVQKGLEAEGEETDYVLHSENAKALTRSSHCLQGILCKLFTEVQGLNYSGVSNY